MLSRNEKRLIRQRRTKVGAFGTAKRPRVSVFKGQNSMKAQIIDDNKGVTIISGDNKKEAEKKFDIASCELLGEKMAKIALEKSIKEVVFDRSG
jgi:large subunit ribosomal protein L18